ncbi:hypothetical protein KC622_01790, partial [Candidatus Dojkabacteria bacterium]|nr:hypothetical protein [Candidatus Dojkabacteria bacterium]
PDRADKSGILFAARRFPNKFPPQEFYVEQIKRLFMLLGSKPLYVHIFTDCKEPEALIEELKVQVNEPSIEFGFRKSSRRSENGVIEDFFNLARFEYIIRPQSEFSYMADKIADWKILIYPTVSRWDGDILTVNEVATLRAS